MVATSFVLTGRWKEILSAGTVTMLLFPVKILPQYSAALSIHERISPPKTVPFRFKWHGKNEVDNATIVSLTGAFSDHSVREKSPSISSETCGKSSTNFSIFFRRNDMLLRCSAISRRRSIRFASLASTSSGSCRYGRLFSSSATAVITASRAWTNFLLQDHGDIQ